MLAQAPGFTLPSLTQVTSSKENQVRPLIPFQSHASNTCLSADFKRKGVIIQSGVSSFNRFNRLTMRNLYALTSKGYLLILLSKIGS
jgi:hypothetical protein